MAALAATELDPRGPDWSDAVDRLRAELGAPDNPRLFPPHFLKATFPKVGGRIVRFSADGRPVAVGCLFPRRGPAGEPAVTLRLHRIAAHAMPPNDLLVALTAALALPGPVTLYDADAEPAYAPTHQLDGGADLGRPDAAEAAAVREMQRTIWGTEPDFLYPADIHSADFGLGCSLVARVDGEPAGFLFGFDTFGGETLPAAWSGRLRLALRQESQLLGVLPRHRGRGLAFWLKRRQALDARAAGIDVVHWTVDPLQWPNAVLNFGHLRAVAFGFHADYYAFRNSLNRVRASRLALSWLVGSARVDAALAPGARAEIVDLSARADIRRLDFPDATPADATGAPHLAIEIPRDWNAVQRDDADAAARWRTQTDALWAALLDAEPGRYALTGVGRNGERVYLLAERLTPDRLDALVAERAAHRR